MTQPTPAQVFDALTRAAEDLVTLPLRLLAGVAEANRMLHDYALLARLPEETLRARGYTRETLLAWLQASLG